MREDLIACSERRRITKFLLYAKRNQSSYIERNIITMKQSPDVQLD